MGIRILTDDQADPTPAEIVAFMDRMAYWRAGELSPSDITYHNFPIADGRILGHAKRALETLAMWKQDAGSKLSLEQLVVMLVGKLKAAVVDKEAGRVEFRFLGSELIELRQAVGYLQEYVLIQERDAREAERPKYRGKKRG